MSRLVIGTRGSRLAMWQAKSVRHALLRAHGSVEIELKVVRTRGDRIRRAPLHSVGGTGLFTRELEEALLDGRVDLAVHSLKDLPTALPEGLSLAAVPMRDDPADAVVAKDRMTLEMIPPGATVLAGSLRRAAQLLHRRGDLEVAPVRGNIETRLRKLENSDARAIVLARAGLTRLGLGDRITQRLDPREFLPACGQGALGVETRRDDARAGELVAAIDDPAAHCTTSAERAMLGALGGGCHVPVGATARLTEDGMKLEITGMVASLDGACMVRRDVRGGVPGQSVSAAEALGRRLAEMLLADGGREILERLT